MNFDKVFDLFRAFEQERVEYVLVGGLAVNLQGVTRATEDVDIVVRLQEDNIERLKRALRRVWDDPRIDDIRYADLAGEYPAVSYGPPDEAFGIDIVARFGQLFPYEDLPYEIMAVEGAKVPVATPQTLYRMKKDTVRSLDRHDVWELKQRYDLKDE